MTRSIDEGAYRAVQRKESGSRLLPAGVVRVEGVFASHQAVNLVVRRRVRERTISQDSRGTAKSREHNEVSGATTPVSYDNAGSRLDSPNSNNHFTAPGTPNLYPVLSLSSSIASLDALSSNGRSSVPQSPATLVKQVMAEMNQGSGTDGPSESTIAFRQLDDDESEAWEEVAIGKGLALYNSVEIDRLRGVKRSVLAGRIPARSWLSSRLKLLSKSVST